MPLSANLRGALFMSVSMAGFTINDTLVKTVSDAMNMGQVMFMRGVFATILLGLIMARTGAFGRFSMLWHWSVALRVLSEVAAAVAFLLALFHLPIANVTAVLQALPLFVTIGAALVFAEPVGWRRWTAILVGLAGVLVIVRPGFSGFSAWSLSALACVCFCTLRDLATHRIPRETPAALVSGATSMAVTLCGAALVPFHGGWSGPSLPATAALFCAAISLVFGYQFIILAIRGGHISFLAPFRYTALLWAIALGYLVFGDVPDLPMLVGAGLVVASGTYALYRERLVGRQQPIAESTGPGMAPDGA